VVDQGITTKIQSDIDEMEEILISTNQRVSKGLEAAISKFAEAKGGKDDFSN
jgi:hypothetical protein